MVPAEATAGVEGTAVAGSSSVLAGGEVGLHLTRSIAIGGSGFTLLRRVRVPGGAGGPTALGFSYGGAFVEYRRPMPGEEEEDGRTLSARLLVGAANTDLVRAGTGADLGAENVLVTHPALGADLPLLSWLSSSIRAGYRWSTEVNDLPGVGAGALRGPTISVGLRLIHTP